MGAGIKARDNFLKRVRDLVAMMMSANAEESDVAKRKLLALLKKHNKTENDVAALLAEWAAKEAARIGHRRHPIRARPGPIRTAMRVG